MSADVFKCFGPIGQGMFITYGKCVGGADLCGTEYFPVGLTAAEFVEWYWMTKDISIECAASATEGGFTATFDGGIVPGLPNRRDLCLYGGRSLTIPATPTAETSMESANYIFAPTGPVPPLPEPLVYAFDGTLYYPLITLQAVLTATDVPGGGAFTSININSLIDSVWGGAPPFTGTATVFGKSVPLGYSIDSTGTGSATFAPIIITKDSDWPYT